MSSVLSKIRTKQDLEYLASDLSTLQNEIFQVSAERHVPAIIKEEFVAASDKSAFLTSLKEEIINALILELTVAIYLDEEALNNVAEWVKNNVGTNVILDINVDKSIVAGCALSYGGKFADFSYKTLLSGAINNIIT